MRVHIPSLKRLYEAKPKRITDKQLKERVKDGRLTEEEYEYITGREYKD